LVDCVECDTSTGDFGDDVVGGCRPDEWFRVVVVDFEVFFDPGD